jgi:hypothetical protein
MPDVSGLQIWSMFFENARHIYYKCMHVHKCIRLHQRLILWEGGETHDTGDRCRGKGPGLRYGASQWNIPSEHLVGVSQWSIKKWKNSNMKINSRAHYFGKYNWNIPVDHCCILTSRIFLSALMMMMMSFHIDLTSQTRPEDERVNANIDGVRVCHHSYWVTELKDEQ